jgi:hypothetical protein
MSGQAYVGTTKRTFQQAVLHLLEHDYGLLGSRRVLTLLVADLQHLVDEFYPPPGRLSSGWLVFTGTKASGSKPHPGRPASDHELVTLAWPVILPTDIQEIITWPTGPAQVAARQQWFQKRLVRIVEHGWHHPQGPVLLTLADLSAMVGLTTVAVSQLLAAARHATSKPLLTKGYYFDQGMRPTHKAEIIALYEAGLDETAIARQTNHAPGSVGKYIRDYERVKLFLTHQSQPTSIEHMGRVLKMQPNVVKAYVQLLYDYHPELVPAELAPSGA